MEKVIKHTLLLCVLLLFGNSLLFSTTLVTPFFATSTSKIVLQEQSTSFGIESQSNVKKPTDGFCNKRFFITDAEEEDTEAVYSKKSVDKTSYCLSPFNLQRTKSYFCSFDDSLVFCKEFSYLPSYKSLYIIFRVFRI